MICMYTYMYMYIYVITYIVGMIWIDRCSIGMANHMCVCVCVYVCEIIIFDSYKTGYQVW